MLCWKLKKSVPFGAGETLLHTSGKVCGKVVWSTPKIRRVIFSQRKAPWQRRTRTLQPRWRHQAGSASKQVAFFCTLRIMLFLFAISLLQKPAASPSQLPQASGTGRSCTGSWNTSAPEAKKKRPKNSPKESHDAPACIELSASALDIQEYLQSFSRNQHWTIVEEHVTEDSWIFSLAMSKDELVGSTKAGSDSEKVQWRSGSALVQISSVTLADGFTRTIVRARFRGYGEAADKFAPQPGYWELESNGTFEASIVSTLKARFKATP